MLKSRIVTGFLLVIFTFITGSCGGTAVKPYPKGRLFFWEVQGASNTVYLMGSIHIADNSIYPLDPVIETALEKSDFVAVELDVAKSQAKINALVIKEGMYPFTDSLENHIPADLYKQLGEYVKKFGLSINGLRLMKPWFVAFTLTGLNLMEMGYSGESGLESYIVGKSRETKTILELESAEFQIKIFSGMSMENQIAFLRSQMLPADVLKKEFETLYGSWKAGNLEEFEQIALGGKDEWEGKFNDTLLFNRNITMTEKIKEYLNGGGTYFVLIGAAHFVGEKGIVSLLEKAGYTVTRY